MTILADKDAAHEPTIIGTAPADVNEPLPKSQAVTNPNGEDEVVDDSAAAIDEDVVPEDDAGVESDDAEDAGDDPPPKADKLQRKLWEAAQARKKLAEAERKIAAMQQQADAFQVLMKHPKAEQILRGLRENGAMDASDAGVQEPTEFVPKGDFGFDEKTDSSLRKMLNASMGQLLGALKQQLAPVAQEVVSSREARQESAWNAIARKAPGMAQFKDATLALMKQKGLDLEDAALLASKGRYALIKQKAQGATVASKTPTLSGRGVAANAVNREPSYRGVPFGEALKRELSKADRD